MSIDPKQVAFFIPPGLKKFKLKLFERIADHISKLGGRIVRHDYRELERSMNDFIPIIGCSPPFASAIKRWQEEHRQWIYWDRGYLRRVFATWLPNGHDLGVPGGYYRWHVGGFQVTQVSDVPGDRWEALKLNKPFQMDGDNLPGLPHPWNKNGDHIVVAHTLSDYWDLRGLPRDWSFKIADELRLYTKRPIIVRDKESKLPLHKELRGAHALVTHGSIAAVEAIALGYPVFVDPESAAAPMGLTQLTLIEQPVYPDDRLPWLHSLAYHQFNENELCDGTLWRLIR
jgi:hypothetical protein